MENLPNPAENLPNPAPKAALPDKEPARADGKGRKVLAFVIELVEVVTISLAIILPVRYFLIKPFYVKGASMEPNFFDHEYLIIDELSYRLHEPGRGDIVVFHYPRDPKQIFIKRVIGLPGETVEIANGKIKIYNTANPNGKVLDEAYLDQEYTSSAPPVTLKAGEYFLMGDNRAASLDSRYFGPIQRSAIIGRVWVRGFPLDRWKWFQEVGYNL